MACVATSKPTHDVEQRRLPINGDSETIQGHDTPTVLNYLDPERSTQGVWKTPTKGVIQNVLNKAWDTRPVVVKDCTPNVDSFKLDTHGFQFVHFESKEKDFTDDERIKAVYYPEVAELLKNMTGAYRAHVFNHIVRGITTDDKPVARPSYFVHCDQSYEGALIVLRDEMGEESDVLSKKRFQIVNVSQISSATGLNYDERLDANSDTQLWKPVKTVRKDPFCVADARSLPEEDLLPIKLTLPSGNLGSGWYLKYNPSHRWFFKYRQTPEEAVVFKNFDSALHVPARRTMHTGFVDETEEDQPMRQSLECRVLLFFDERN